MKRSGWIVEAVGAQIFGASARRLQIRMPGQLPNLKPLTIDFIGGETQRRAKSIALSGGKTGLLQALRSIHRPGTAAEDPPLLLDATAGLGRDALQLALAGYRVVMVERCLSVALLLAEAILAARSPDAATCSFGGGLINKMSAVAQRNLACVHHPLGAEELLRRTALGLCNARAGTCNCAQVSGEPITVVRDVGAFWHHITGDGPLNLERRAGQDIEAAAEAQLDCTPVLLRPHIPSFAVPFHAKGKANTADLSDGCCWWRALGLSPSDRLAGVTIDPMWDALSDAPPNGSQGAEAPPRSTLKRKGTQQRELQYLEALAAPTSQMEIRGLIEAAAQAVAAHRSERADPPPMRASLASVVVKQHVRAPPLWELPQKPTGKAAALPTPSTTGVRLIRTVPGTVARFDLYG